MPPARPNKPHATPRLVLRAQRLRSAVQTVTRMPAAGGPVTEGAKRTLVAQTASESQPDADLDHALIAPPGTGASTFAPSTCGAHDSQLLPESREASSRPRTGNMECQHSSALPSPAPSCAPQTPALSFAACFESANLRAAVRVGDFEYDLVLARDINDASDLGMRCQWFYFAVSGAHAPPGATYRFNVVNFCKGESLYSSGARPLLACPDNPAALGTHPGAWRRCGTDIAYYPSPYRVPPRTQAPETVAAPRWRRQDAPEQRVPPTPPGGDSASDKLWKALGPTADAAGKGLYALSFDITFPTPDRFFLATCYPYTYTDLQRFLLREALRTSAAGLDFAASPSTRRSLLCQSEGGNRCDLLTITDFTASAEELAQRDVVMLTARVHPGESNASWVMQVRVPARHLRAYCLRKCARP